MFDIDEAANTATALRLGDDVQAERRLAGTLRTIDLDDAPAREAANAQRDIETEAAAGDCLDIELRGIP